MINTLPKYLYRFSTPWSLQKLTTVTATDSQFNQFHKVDSIFKKLLKNDYINPQSLVAASLTLSRYSPLHLGHQQVQHLHHLVNDRFHLLNNDQLFSCALFLSKVDAMFQESKIYEYITKHYLNSRYQLLKLNLKIDYTMPIWKIINHLISRLLVMRYGSTTTSFEKSIDVPLSLRKELLLSLVNNSVIKDSLLVQKIHKQIFYEIKQFYEINMKENLYHNNQKVLLNKILSNMDVWLIQNPVFDQENHLIRTLLLNILLARRDQNKNIDISEGTQGFHKESFVQSDKSLNLKNQVSQNQLRCIWMLYTFVKNKYQQSSEKQQYLELMEQQMQNCIRAITKIDTILPFHFEMISQKDSISQQYQKILVQGLQKVKYFPNNLYQKLLDAIKRSHKFSQLIKINLPSILSHLSLSQLIDLPVFYEGDNELISLIYKSILQLQDFQLTENDVIKLLEVLKQYHSLQYRKPIRDFLFKYISDNFSSFLEENKVVIKETLERFPDKDQPFDDTGLYKNTIFEEISHETNKK